MPDIYQPILPRTVPANIDYVQIILPYKADLATRGLGKVQEFTSTGKRWDCTGLVDRAIESAEVPDHVLRAWYRREYLFESYGKKNILVDDAGWFFTIPWRLSAKIAEELGGNTTVLDAFCGMGGNAVNFARAGKRVIALESSQTRLSLARHNAKQYGVADKILFLLGDFADLAPMFAASGQIDAVFIAPTRERDSIPHKPSKRICPYFQRGNCLNGTRCENIHQIPDLKSLSASVDKLDLGSSASTVSPSGLTSSSLATYRYKTVPCKYYKFGQCGHGEQCTFLHDEDPYTRKSLGTARRGKQLCKHFAKGNCNFGSACHFSHEVKSSDASTSWRTVQPGPSLPISPTASSSSAACGPFSRGYCSQGSNCPHTHLRKDPPPPYGLNTFKPLPVSKLHEIASTIAPRIAIYLPAGERLEEIAQLGGGGGELGGEAEGEGQGEGEGKVTVWQMTFEKRKREEMKAKALVCFWGTEGK